MGKELRDPGPGFTSTSFVFLLFPPHGLSSQIHPFTDFWTKPATTLLSSGSSSKSYPKTPTLEELTYLSPSLQRSSQTLLDSHLCGPIAVFLALCSNLAVCLWCFSFLNHSLELNLTNFMLLFLHISSWRTMRPSLSATVGCWRYSRGG